MTKILIEDFSIFEISDIEKSEDVPSYSVDTLTKLNHNKDNLYFILGSDTAMNIKTWNNYEKLSILTNFLIALRREDNINSLNDNFPFEYNLIDGEKLDLSSTFLREKIEQNLFDEDDISSKIINYIKKNNIY
jgi:nicotinate-nucleotide adenylyltransferase